MNAKLAMVLVLGLSFAGLVGCRTAPVYNVVDAPVVTDKKGYTLDDMKKAIVRAGGTLGWQMTDMGSNNIQGTLHLRSHMAQVDIPYTKESYSILYKDSSDLNYDGEIIHRNYNGWVQNLDRAIKVQLDTL